MFRSSRAAPDSHSCNGIARTDRLGEQLSLLCHSLGTANLVAHWGPVLTAPGENCHLDYCAHLDGSRLPCERPSLWPSPLLPHGTFFLIMAISGLVHGFKIIWLGPNGWVILVSSLVVLGWGALWYLPEKIWGRYRKTP